MKITNINGKYVNLDLLVEVESVAAPSGQVDNITTKLVFAFSVGNPPEPYKIHIHKPISDVLKLIEQAK
jgi:hypothetical protein